MKRTILFLLAVTAAVSVVVAAPGGAGGDVGEQPDAKTGSPKFFASFRGGDMVDFSRFVLDNLTFSEDRYAEGTRFGAAVTFQVTKKGGVKSVELRTSSGDNALDAEVLRVVGESTGWTPRKDGASDRREMLHLNMMLVRGADGKLHAEDHWAYKRADTMPKFEGGGPGKFKKWVAAQVGDLDPEGAPIDARAALRFVIEKDGSLSEVSVDDRTPAWLVERLGEAFGRMPRWTPAEMRGEKVRIQASMQLLFGKAAEEAKAGSPGKAAKSDSPGEADKPYLLVEQMPNFQGGDLNTFRNWVKCNVKYPADMYKQGVEGRVLATFIINRDGTLSDVKILQSSAGEFSQEVVNVLGHSPKWTPGKHNGKAVRVKYTVPVDFRIPAGLEYRGDGRPANPSRTDR